MPQHLVGGLVLGKPPLPLRSLAHLPRPEPSPNPQPGPQPDVIPPRPFHVRLQRCRPLDQFQNDGDTFARPRALDSEHLWSGAVVVTCSMTSVARSNSDVAAELLPF